jgi:UDP-N-acetylmuramate: L-alanyl-gamma-D-glutamyl-meso-diaminopimelate ligase
MTTENGKTIYLMGIGGIAMGTLATMLIKKGYRVMGSDQNLYPPMSTHLESLKIQLHQGYHADNVRPHSPDLVVVGNVIRRENPEARYVLEHSVPYLSMPEAINRFFLPHHKSMVVAGTHGKSTTSALLAWLLTQAGLDPSCFIGAFLRDWGTSYRLGHGPYMVLEGDEYDTAFFDKGSKFLHYRPHIAILTSIEFDHADIFRDLDAVIEAFRRFVQIIPEEGVLIVNGDDPHCAALARECRGRVETYGISEEAHWRLLETEYADGAVRFRFRHRGSPGESTVESGMPGRHNALNALAVLAAGAAVGVPLETMKDAILSFRGVKRRQERLGEANGIVVIDDFAHHPTAVRETIQAMRRFYPARRLIAVFEPRTNSSKRRVFQRDYAAAFDEADVVFIKQPPGLDAISAEERLDAPRLVEEIKKRSIDTRFCENAETLLADLRLVCERGDLVLCMSNGGFDGVPHRLMESLNKRSTNECVRQ